MMLMCGRDRVMAAESEVVVAVPLSQSAQIPMNASARRCVAVRAACSVFGFVVPLRLHAGFDGSGDEVG